jgi:hypothetical protein
MFKTILFLALILTVCVYADEEVAKIATANAKTAAATANVSKNFKNTQYQRDYH